MPDRDPHDRRDCEWCRRTINPLKFVTFDDGIEDLEFCDDDCLANYEEREHDRRVEREEERRRQ